MTRRCVAAILVLSAWASSPAKAEIRTFDDRQAFEDATQPEGASPYPNLGLTDTPYQHDGSTFTFGPRSFELYVGAKGLPWSDWTPLMEGNEIALSGPEDLDIQLDRPRFAFGMDMVEPTTGNLGGPFVDSTFQITLKAGDVVVGTFSFAPPNDVLTFVGVWSSEAFDRVEIREVVGGIGNEFFGQVLVGDLPLPLVRRVRIDVKPGDAQNLVHPSARLLWVAVLGSEDLDVTEIDDESLTLSGAPLFAAKGWCGDARLTDVDGDGFTDLLVKARVADLNLPDEAGAQISLTLEGTTFEGLPIVGEDVATVAPRWCFPRFLACDIWSTSDLCDDDDDGWDPRPSRRCVKRVVRHHRRCR